MTTRMMNSIDTLRVTSSMLSKTFLNSDDVVSGWSFNSEKAPDRKVVHI